MADKAEANRLRIAQAANELFYRKGFNQTSFSDIAEAVGLARGNFYYYFKTKDEILAAVVAHRMDGIAAMLAEWDKETPDPRNRLKRFVGMLLTHADEILRYGCPMGSLNVELSKTQRGLQAKAIEMFDLFRTWIERQLRALGHGDDARLLALHMLARSQGVSLLTNVYSDKAFLDHEAGLLMAWIDQL